MRKYFSIKGIIFYIILIVFYLMEWGCSQNNIRKEDPLAQMTDNQLLMYYHAIGERIEDIEMRHRIDKELNRSHFEHDIVLDLSIDGKIYKLEKKRKMILQELQRRNSDNPIKSQPKPGKGENNGY